MHNKEASQMKNTFLYSTLLSLLLMSVYSFLDFLKDVKTSKFVKVFHQSSEIKFIITPY